MSESSSIRHQLILEIEKFLADMHMDATTLGKSALNDGNFIFRFRKGVSPKIETVDRLRSFMLKYRQDRNKRRK